MEALRCVTTLGFSHNEEENGGFTVVSEFTVNVDGVDGPRRFEVCAMVVVA